MHPKYLLKLILLASAVVAINAQAQVSSKIQIGVSPTSPIPDQEVRLQVTSASFDLSRSVITWIKDGKTVLKGLGETAYFFNAGKLGSKTAVEAQAETPDGLIFKTSKTITVADAILVWSAFTTVPTLYPGKALASANSLVRVTAIPFLPLSAGSFDTKSGLSFTWYLDDEIKGSRSGFGKDFFEFRTALTPGSEASVRVKIENRAKSLSVEKVITIPIQPTQVHLYLSHPVSGANLGKAYESLSLRSGEEKRFSAQPFYFDSTKSSTLKTRWLLDNESLPSPPQQENVIIFKTPQVEEEITRKITVIFTNARNIYQETRKDFLASIKP